MSNLFGPPPTKLRAITINGCIVVESDNDVKRREERRKNKKSRWEKTADIVQVSSKVAMHDCLAFFQVLAISSPVS